MLLKVAIIGAGFCGLAVAWELLNLTAFNIEVTLFDAEGIGGGASGIAAGLLHPFAGAHAKLNWKGFEGMAAAEELLAVASGTLGRSVFAKNRGILRLALTDEQEADYKLCAERYQSQVEWLDTQACKQLIPECAKRPGLMIKPGLTVYCPLYLTGLWQACAKKGVHFIRQKIDKNEQVKGYDLTILAAGAAAWILSRKKSSH